MASRRWKGGAVVEGVGEEVSIVGFGFGFGL